VNKPWRKFRLPKFSDAYDKIKHRYFYRLVWFGLLSACIPVILAGTVYYQFMYKNVLNQTKETTRHSLSLIMERMENILTDIEQNSLQLALNPAITQSLDDTSFVSNYDLQRLVYDELVRQKSRNRFIADIVYYRSSNSDLVSIDYGYAKQSNYKGIVDLTNTAVASSSSRAKWVYLPEAKKLGYLTFIRRLPFAQDERNQGAIMIHMYTDSLRIYLEDGDSLKSRKSIFVLNPAQNVMFHSGSMTEADFRQDNRIFDSIIHSGQATDLFFVKKQDGSELLLSYMRNAEGWTYVVLIPKEEINKQISWIRSMIILAVICLSGMSILLTYQNSKRIYSPIQALINHGQRLSRGRVFGQTTNDIHFIQECLNYLSEESERVNSYLEKMAPTIRERFFFNLLKNQNMSRIEVQEAAKELNIRVGSSYTTLVVDIENIYKEKRFFSNDVQIFSFIITNVMEELLRENVNLEGYVLNFHDAQGVAVIMSRDLTYTELINEMKIYADQICQALETYIKFKASVGVGRVYSHITDVAVSYQEALHALSYRMFLDTGHVLYIEDMEMAVSETSTIYPKQDEDAIINALNTRNDEDAKKALISFSNEVKRSHSFIFIYQSFQMLFTSIIYSIQRQGGSIFELLNNDLFNQLAARKTSNELVDWFIDVCFPLYKQQIDQNINDKGKREIERICDYINDNIDSDVSLSYCSEMVELSPSYVSQLFRKFVGKSYMEYIVQCKIDKSKELLLDTEYNLSKIAFMVGYSERNLSRVFQKVTGLTPGQFRSNHR
jgi:two-component system response regulator YesN